jgi:peptidyl-prolyl cis-trans isomerase B (cyclophilin B)
VVSGKEIVDAIEQVRTGSRGGHGDVPLDDVTITRATVVS